MKAFIELGKIHPKKTITKQGVRKAIVKAIVTDDLPFTFARKKGTRELLEYVLPFSMDLPSHQTVGRDVKELYLALSNEVSLMIKVHFSIFFLVIRQLNVVVDE